jgi:pantothenate kinase
MAGVDSRAPRIAWDVDALADRVRAMPGQRVILGLCGTPGAGKSTLAGALAAALGAVVVPMDGFHLAQAELERLGRADRKGAPDTFDAAGYRSMIVRLAERRDDVVYAPRFDREIEDSVAGAIAVPRGIRYVITEGNYLLRNEPDWRAAHAAMSAVWYLDIDPAVRRERLIARHVAFGRSPSAAREWVLRSDEANAREIERDAMRADAIVAQH